MLLETEIKMVSQRKLLKIKPMVKQLLAGCALIIVLGGVGFFYRNSVENPKIAGPNVASNEGGQGSGNGAACTQEAKICPDGSAVGRTGPNCAFSACLPPNVELTQSLSTSSTTDVFSIGFVLPPGYKKNIVTSDDPTYLASYIQSNEIPAGAASSAGASTIDIYNYPFSGVSEQTGSSQKSASAIMLSHTYFTSGTQATSTSSFNTVTEGTNTFYEVLLGKSSTHIQSSYYLYTPTSVLRFDITEQLSGTTAGSVITNPNALPQHQALQQMLATLQVD
jgi:hypothetical protein